MRALRDTVAFARHRAIRFGDAGCVENFLVNLDLGVVEPSSQGFEHGLQQGARFVIIWQFNPVKQVVSIAAVSNNRSGPPAIAQMYSDLQHQLFGCRLFVIARGDVRWADRIAINQ